MKTDNYINLLTKSSHFLEMPTYLQNLYFHLHINQDEDELVDSYAILCTLNLSILALQELKKRNLIDHSDYMVSFKVHFIPKE